MGYKEKRCKYCRKVGTAYTFTNGVTICPRCFESVSSDIVESWDEIFELRKLIRRALRVSPLWWPPPNFGQVDYESDVEALDKIHKQFKAAINKGGRSK